MCEQVSYTYSIGILLLYHFNGMDSDLYSIKCMRIQNKIKQERWIDVHTGGKVGAQILRDAGTEKRSK